MHMKFQVNILSSSGITRGDRPTIHPSDHPTDIVDCRDSRRIQKSCYALKWGGFREMPFELSELRVAPVDLLRVALIELLRVTYHRARGNYQFVSSKTIFNNILNIFF